MRETHLGSSGLKIRQNIPNVSAKIHVFSLAKNQNIRLNLGKEAITHKTLGLHKNHNLDSLLSFCVQFSIV